MEIVLLAITIISLAVAFVMSAAAWRLSRDERTRSAARVAALAAAASDAPPEELQNRPHDRRVEEPAIQWEPVAVNETRSAAPWAPARVSSFPTESQDRTPDRRVVRPTASSEAAAFGDGFLGSAVAQPASGGRQRGLAIAACVLFVALFAGGYWMVFGDAPASAQASASPSKTPLELVSLRHERRGARLSITGLVRNPAAGTAVERLAAVVFLFDPQGAFVTSARADVDFTRLAPGDESPFVIAVDAPSSVARYRVSFRNDGGVVPHIDRRGQEPIARALP